MHRKPISKNAETGAKAAETLQRQDASRVAHAARRGKEKGVALLAVLWLAVALSFIGMATAQLVRTEVTAVDNRIDAERGYYLARGGIEAAVDSIVQSDARRSLHPDAPVQPAEFVAGKRRLDFEFPGGSCVVDVVPENAKININRAPPEQLAALFTLLGMAPNESRDMAAATEEWRNYRASDVDTATDVFYANLPQPYAARHAPLDNVEELLPVRGMRQEFFFGHYEKTREGNWRHWPALLDLLTTQASVSGINPNYAPYEVLSTQPGWNEAMAAELVAARARGPFTSLDDIHAAVPQTALDTGLAAITFSQGPEYTLTATAILPGSGVRRSVRALVVVGASLPLYHRVLGWWDEWPSPADLARGAATSGDNTQPSETRGPS